MTQFCDTVYSNVDAVLKKIAQIKNSEKLRYGTWLHVDAAYAGSTFIDPKYREVA